MIKFSTFIHFLQDLTTIQGLLPDPQYRGSGLHMTASGGTHTNIHANFNKYQDPYQLDCCVYTFIYLNYNWLEDYSGHLELWSPNIPACRASCQPWVDLSSFLHQLFLSWPPSALDRSIGTHVTFYGSVLLYKWTSKRRVFGRGLFWTRSLHPF
jgi:hypothetical protein